MILNYWEFGIIEVWIIEVLLYFFLFSEEFISLPAFYQKK